MRVTRSFLDEAECLRLRPGECIIRVNARRNMMRIFMGGDKLIEPGMLTAWSLRGHKWSRETIANWARNGANVELDGIYDGARKVENSKLKIVKKVTKRAA